MTRKLLLASVTLGLLPASGMALDIGASIDVESEYTTNSGRTQTD